MHLTVGNNTMKNTIIAAAVLALAVSVRAQSQPKPKPLSEAFAKVALHVVAALHDSPVSALADQHIEVLFEEVVIQQHTRQEALIAHDLANWRIVHAANQLEAVSLACLDAYTRSLKARSSIIPKACKLAQSEQRKQAVEELACFDEQVTDLKANSPIIPCPRR
jgi:hypothetical protein